MEQGDFDRMEIRYGAAFMQGIRDGLAACQLREFHNREIQQMEEILFRFRERARAMIMHYRVWQNTFRVEKDEVERVYKSYEGMFLRQQLRDAWNLYLTVNRDLHELRRDYLAA